MLKNLKRAFTLAEVIVVFTVIGVVMTLAIAITARKNNFDEKRMMAITESYYANISNAYSQILNYKTANGLVTEIADSSKLREYFNTYLDADIDDYDCSKLKYTLTGTNGFVDNDSKTPICAMHANNVIVGYYLDKSCSTTVKAKETYVREDAEENKNNENSINPREVTNACGYIVYGIKGNKKGRLGEDVFTIALGKVTLK